MKSLDFKKEVIAPIKTGSSLSFEISSERFKVLDINQWRLLKEWDKSTAVLS